ncbi:hypothetical protein HanRHA438_Chr05g0206311 [Helianthus annuus]|uniref:Uncharacterized protein n=1 Tax=Helianthus annuus TaxID=4232 RepID=A0A9K3IXE6_HELAN|nr:hypothetical protein HanXRQr2_Chr05g0196801 [Helianthus annuus]KAJ0569055.1 hypothetical protein HanHA300_Chr05g0161711 [Helianthus annuus]KAJ0583335.1 hypothetical protein HanHA89_Chr05g0175391 [Helianthus annuus]KAJ0719337.1 hypothetical protein HanLR1_Chr08g0280571 [Helianthus annuus]KAJ0746068.1 hypothetical protein HanOQP8_Chr05g0173301 [Helianthus annuus]
MHFDANKNVVLEIKKSDDSEETLLENKRLVVEAVEKLVKRKKRY